MQIRFIANASFEITMSTGQKIFTDPWWEPGTYLGTWHNFPPIPRSLLDELYTCKPTFIYISHLHPDHFDLRTLEHFDRRTPIVIGKLTSSHLLRALVRNGFRNVVECKFWEWQELFGVELMLLPQFQTNSSGVENLIDYQLDTSMVIQDSGLSFLNLVDNSMTVAQARDLRERLGSPSIAALPYSGASSYPHAFNYSASEKIRKVKETRSAALSHFRALVEELRPEVVIPAAGSYVFPRPFDSYNSYLQQATPEEICRSLTDIRSNSTLANLDAGGTLTRDFDGWRIDRVQDWTETERIEYGKSLFGSLAYQNMEIPDETKLPWARILQRCSENLKKKQNALSAFTEIAVSICLKQHPDFKFAISLSATNEIESLPWIEFEIDERLLFLIVNGSVDWNNAEVGSHMKIDRWPDVHNATAHSLMSYFSLLS